MGDMGEDFKAMREASKAHRTDKQEWSKELLIEWCGNTGVNVAELQPWHVRLTDGDKQLDIYPQRQRWHNLNTNKRGGYKDLIDFVTKHFKK